MFGMDEIKEDVYQLKHDVSNLESKFKSNEITDLLEKQDLEFRLKQYEESFKETEKRLKELEEKYSVAMDAILSVLPATVLEKLDDNQKKSVLEILTLNNK